MKSLIISVISPNDEDEVHKYKISHINEVTDGLTFMTIIQIRCLQIQTGMADWTGRNMRKAPVRISIINHAKNAWRNLRKVL